MFVLLFEELRCFQMASWVPTTTSGAAWRNWTEIDEVVAVTTQDHIAGTQDDFIVEPLIDVRTLAQSRPADRQKRVLERRAQQGVMAAADGPALAMVPSRRNPATASSGWPWRSRSWRP